MVGLFVSVAVAGVYAIWNERVYPGDTITANRWNEVVEKLTEIDAEVAAIQAGGKVSALYDCTKEPGVGIKSCNIGTHDVCFMAGVDSWSDDADMYDGCFINGTQGGSWTIDIDCAHEDKYICSARCLDL